MSGYGTEAGFCEHGNGTSGLGRGEKFFFAIRTCSVELVSEPEYS
jgi:hypothetical protein